MELYFWAPDGRPLGTATVSGAAVRLASDADPALIAAWTAIYGRSTLPLVVRRMTEDGHEVVTSEVARGEADHWVALTDALGRETGCVMTLTADAPS